MRFLSILVFVFVLGFSGCVSECPEQAVVEDTGSDSGFGDHVVKTDTDGDGYLLRVDCDDTDPSIHPGATEICDGVDNDCDGEVDVAAVDADVFCEDNDGDGFGNDQHQMLACAQPDGYVSDNTDCDDIVATTNPDAEEICDDRDNDCSGLVDEPSFGDVDADGDGFIGCDDCDDTNADINPGADELCDSVDNDCDGGTDEADAVDALTWYADADGDGCGETAWDTVACTQPPGYVSDDCE